MREAVGGSKIAKIVHMAHGRKVAKIARGCHVSWGVARVDSTCQRARGGRLARGDNVGKGWAILFRTRLYKRVRRG
jgi:hypothetical protein